MPHVNWCVHCSRGWTAVWHPTYGPYSIVQPSHAMAAPLLTGCTLYITCITYITNICLSVWKTVYVTPLLYLYVTHWSLLAPQPLYVLPDHLSLSTGLISDLAVILILSSYVSLCATSLTFLICTDFPTYVSLCPLWLLSIVMTTCHSVLTLCVHSLRPRLLYLATHLRVHF